MAERINRSHDNVKPWERVGLKLAAIVAVGATALTLAGCGSEKADAGHAPDRPTATASATPGSNEGSKTPSETASSSPEATKSFEAGKTVLTNSEVYNSLSELDQTSVEKNAQLSFDDFEKLPVDERALVALVLSDAHSAEYIKAVGDLVLPGNNGQPLKDIYIPVQKKHSNAAQDLYDWEIKSTPDDITASNNGQPYFQHQFELGIGYWLASSGDPQLLEDSKKILGGSFYHGSEQVVGGGVAYDQEGWGNLTQRINDLRTMNETKVDTLKYLGYPDAGTDRHDFAMETSGPFEGHPGTVSLGFVEYDPTSQSMVEGPNSDGAAAAVYKLTKYDTKDGHHRAIWTEMEAHASADSIVLEPNPTQ